MEDLWAFNEEIVARAVYNSKIPVISAVGHETDFTICDFAADQRASTPSVAAELAVPVRREQEVMLMQMQNRMTQALAGRLSRQRLRLENLIRNRVFRQPQELVDRRRMECDRLMQSLHQTMKVRVAQTERHFSILSGKLDALSPLKVLSRGYSVVTHSDTGRVLLSSALVKPGDRIDVWLSDGILNCDVRQVGDRR